MFSTPLWASPFRPFYLAGTLYALILAAAALVPFLAPGVASGGFEQRGWHGHEMIFGFAAAIVSGITLSALPSWAGTPETDRGRLVFLVLLWCLGRVSWWSEALSLSLRAVIDASFFLVAAALIAPALWRARNPRFRLLPLIFALLALAQTHFYTALAASSAEGMQRALTLAVHAFMLLYTLKGGVLTPTFTANALAERAEVPLPEFNLPLEYACAGCVTSLVVSDLFPAPPAFQAVLALLAAMLIGARQLRWKPWRVLDLPMLAAMNAGFLFFEFALVLEGLEHAGLGVPRALWVHAFTVGGLGLMMLSLMNRVSLRHTGRPLNVPLAMRLALLLIVVAASTRIVAALLAPAPKLIALAMTAWAFSFALYLASYARLLIAPSLPRASTEEEKAALTRET